MTSVASVLLAVVFTVGACGTAEQGAAPGGGGGAISPSGVDPESPVSSTPDPNAPPPGESRAQRVRPRPGMADLRPVAWEKARQTPSGRALRVTYWSGVEPCNVLDHVDVEYSASKITVTLYEGHDPDEADVACIEIALLKAVVVRLEEPVDGRKIVDGAK